MIRMHLAIFLPLLIVFGLLCFGAGMALVQYRHFKEAERQLAQEKERFLKLVVQQAKEHQEEIEELERTK